MAIDQGCQGNVASFDSAATLWYAPLRAMSEPMPLEALAVAVRTAFGARARVVAAEPLAGDASTRRYVRLRLADDASPPTVVAMLFGSDRLPLGSEEIGGEVGGDELPFVNVGRYLAEHALPVPRVHHRTDTFLLLEDIGDTTLFAAARADTARVSALFGAAVDLVVALQVAGARQPAPGCYAFRQRFDGRLARWELEHFVEHGIETRHGKRLPAAERAALLTALAPLAEPFERATPVLAHRDFHAWNLHVHDGRLRLIDFQDALLAPDAYDVASLLTDRTTAELVPPALETSLLERFVRGRAAAGVPVEPGFSERYRRCALQRALKVIGRFYFLERVKGKPGYLAYLPAVYGVARRLLRAEPALASVLPELVRWVPELGEEPRA